MKIELPSIAKQQRYIVEQANEQVASAIKQSLSGLPEKHGIKIMEIKHLLTLEQGWQAPSPEVIRSYFENFKENFPEYGSDNKLANLLGLSEGRVIRAYKEGSRIPSYGLWRKFLIMTGRAPQEYTPVLAIFNDE